MKQKTIAVTYILILALATMIHIYIPQTEAAAERVTVIPNEAIRLRILANSDRNKDQVVKQKVRDAVNEEITEWVEKLTTLEDARGLLQQRLPDIQAIAEQTVEEAGVHQTVQVEFSTVQFPTKLYGQFLYPAGEYEAILITLGAGNGANWWCVLFPPLCFLDFSNGVAVSDGFEEETEADTTERDAEGKGALKKGDNREKGGKEKGAVQGKQGNKQEEHVDGETVNEKGETGINGWKREQEANRTEITGEQQDGEMVVDENETDKPVYVKEDEEPVKVKFFIVELFQKLFKL